MNEQPPTILANSSTFEIVPLCAIHRSLTLSGCAFSRLLLPRVEYRTWPIDAEEEYSSAIFLNSVADAETRPNFFSGGLFGTAIPQASCPLCCNARSASIVIGITFEPSRLKIATTPQFSLTMNY